MSRSIKKGPYIHPSLEKKVMAMRNASNRTVIKTWCARFDHPSRDDRPHHRRPRRTAPCAGVLHREHGWATSSANSPSPAPSAGTWRRATSRRICRACATTSCAARWIGRAVKDRKQSRSKYGAKRPKKA